MLLGPSPWAAGAGWFWSSRIRAHDRTGCTKIGGREGASRAPHGPRTRLALQPRSVPGVEDWARAPPAFTSRFNGSFCGVILYKYLYLRGVGAGLSSAGWQVLGRGIFIAVKIKGWGQPCVPRLMWQGGFSGTVTPLPWLSPTLVAPARVVALVSCSRHSWGWCWGCHRVPGPRVPLDVTRPSLPHSRFLFMTKRVSFDASGFPAAAQVECDGARALQLHVCHWVHAACPALLPSLPVRAPNAE